MDRSGALLPTAALLALCVLAAGVELLPPLNHDVGAVLQFAERLLDGERLYVDLVDINPPMVFWLSAGAIAAGRVVELAPHEAYLAAVLGLSVCATAGLAVALRRLGSGPSVALALPAAVLLLSLVGPRHGFGQREHLMALLALPYLGAAALRIVERRPGGFWTGLAAAIAAVGICLKPHFALVPLAVEATVLAFAGRRATFASPAFWAIAVLLPGYVAATAAIHPAYLAEIVPLVRGFYIEDTAAQYLAVLIGDRVPPLLAFLLPCIAAEALLPTRLAGAGARGVGIAFGAAALGALGAGFAQGKGWDYHFLAADLFALGLAAALGLGIIDAIAARIGPDGRALRRIAAFVLVGPLLIGSGALSPPFWAQREYPRSPVAELLPVVRTHAAGRPVLWLTSSIYPHFPTLTYAGSRLAMRFMSLWMLDHIYRDDKTRGGRIDFNAPSAMGSAERYLFDSLVRDALAAQPALIIAADGPDAPGFGGHPFGYLAYLSQDPAFAALLAGFERQPDVAGMEIWVRRAP